MKKFAAIAGLLGVLGGSSFAQMEFSPPGPEDERESSYWDGIQFRPEFAARYSAYRELLRTRFLILHPEDASRVFGSNITTALYLRGDEDKQYWPETNHHLVKLVLPLVGSRSMGGLDIPLPKDAAHDHSHRDLHAIGNLGYVRLYYLSERKNVLAAVIYFRIDDKFVSLGRTNDLSKRWEWEKAKFDALERWLDEHMPCTDLGTVKLSDGSRTRLELGTEHVCVVRVPIDAGGIRPRWDTVMIERETTNVEERSEFREIRTIFHPGESITFFFDGKFIRLTPEFDHPAHEPQK